MNVYIFRIEEIQSCSYDQKHVSTQFLVLMINKQLWFDENVATYVYFDIVLLQLYQQ